MIITCEECSTQFTLDDSLINPQGSKVRCSRCQHVFTAFLPAQDIQPPVFEVPEELDFDDPDFSDSQDFSDEASFDEDPDISQKSDVEFSQAEDFETQDPDFEFDDIEFDEDSEFDEPQDPGLSLETEENETDPETQEIAFEESELEFDEPEFEEPEPEFDTLELEKDEGPELGLEDTKDAQTPEDLTDLDMDDETADIEISFDQDGETLELSGLTLEAESDESDLEELEFDAPELELSLDDDPDADLVFEDDQIHEDLEPALAMEDSQTIPDTDEEDREIQEDLSMEETAPDADKEESQEHVLEESDEDEKFSAYDKVLDQDVEPEYPLSDNTPEPEDEAFPRTESDIEEPEESDTETPSMPMGAKALIDPPSVKETRKKRAKSKKSRIGSPVKILFLLFLLIIAAYVLSLKMGAQIPFLSDIKIPFLTQILKPAPAPKPIVKPMPNESTINGRFVSNASAGELFVVTGSIENPSDKIYSHIQVKGTLLTKDKANAGTQTVFCGNIIAEETLKSGNISDIQKELTIKAGHQDTNINIKPGGSVMFMLVFSSLPENLTNFTVEVLDFQPLTEK